MNSSFDRWAKENNWKTVVQNRCLPQEILERYNNIPKSWLTFIKGYGSILNEEENIWFLTAENYCPKSEDEWRYNEFELISHEAADEDEELISEVKQFWDNHFPIIISVADGYQYYAIELDSGKIVCGYEPEFEEAETLAENFDEFLEMIINNEVFTDD